MKVLFKNLVAGYTGRVDDLVIYYSKQINRCVVRRVPLVKLKQRHRDFGLVQRNIYNLLPSDGYKQDLNAYRAIYNKMHKNKDRLLSNWTNPYQILMYEMQRRFPGQVNLQTISRQQIVDQNLPCICVKDAVEFGLLPFVNGYERFGHQI